MASAPKDVHEGLMDLRVPEQVVNHAGQDGFEVRGAGMEEAVFSFSISSPKEFRIGDDVS